MYLLFDIGGTNMRIAFSQDGSSISKFKIFPTPKNSDEGIFLLKQAAGSNRILAVSGGIAGLLDENKTMLIRSPHLPGWVGKPLKDDLTKILQTKVFLENDTALIGLGEAVFGAGRDKNIVAYIGVGTGVGGARIVNKEIDKKALGFEPGHQIIEINGKSCHCGGQGHLEAYVGGNYTGRDANWDQVARYLSVGLNNTIVHWSPDIVVLGGSVMKSLSLEKIKTYLKENLTIFPETPEIVLAQLENKGGLYGALSNLSKNHFPL